MNAVANRWSTEAVPARERFAYWREAVCAAVIGADTQDPPALGFAARIAATRWGGRGFVRFRSSPHLVVRSPALISRSAETPFLVTLQFEGESHYWDGARSVSFRRGDVAVVDTGRPFQLTFRGEVERVIAIVPRVLIEAGAWSPEHTVTRLAGGGAHLGLVRAYLSAARSQDASAFAEPDAARLVDHLAELVAFAARTRLRAAERHESRAASGRQALFDHVAIHSADPELSPRRVAATLGMPLRRLHALFAEADTSFGRFLLAHRLDGCRTDLADPAHAARTISDIALGRGFNDLAHFSRAFKARFGVSPRDWRAASHARRGR